MAIINIEQTGNILTFTRGAGDCYGGERKTEIDTQGKQGRALRLYLTKHVGAQMSKVAAEWGFCSNPVKE